MVLYFVDQMRQRIANEADHTPLSAPVIEIGFSIDPYHRLREHRRHRKSNYLMNLAEATFKHVFPDTFGLHQKVIFTCYRPAQPWISEVILTQLAQGYTEGAGGFSHHPAGYSNGGAYRRISEKAWAGFLAKANERDALEEGLAEINAATQARINARKAEEVERERERKELELEKHKP